MENATTISSALYNTALKSFIDYELAMKQDRLMDADNALRQIVELKEQLNKEFEKEQNESMVTTSMLPIHLSNDKTATTPDEFVEIASSKCMQTRVDDKFRLTTSQQRVQSHFVNNPSLRSMIIFHGTGRGKTCTALSLCERFRSITFPFIASSTSSKDKRPLILVPAHLKQNVLRQICNVYQAEFSKGKLLSDNLDKQCLGNRYLVKVPDRFDITSKEILQSKVNKMVMEKYYHIMSHIEFANYIDKIEQSINRVTQNEDRRIILLSQKLRRMFSNRMIVIDEIHNLRSNNTEESSKKVPPRLIQVLKSSDNVRLVLMTATPLFNDAKEIVFLTNLLLINEKKRPLLETSEVFDGETSISDFGSKILMSTLRHRISVVTGSDPYTFPLQFTPDFHGDANLMVDAPKYTLHNEIIPNTSIKELLSLKLVVSQFNGHSKKMYMMMERIISVSEYQVDSSDEDDDIGASGQNDFHIGLQVSNIAFPGVDASALNGYGTNGIKKCLRMNNKGTSMNVEYLPHVPMFLSPSLCGQYAPKIKTIIDRVASSSGKILLYSAYKLTGVLPIAIALEHIGFKRYRQSDLLISNRSEIVHMSAYNPKDAPSYIVWTGDKALCAEDSHLDVFNSDANVDGSLIKVLICTRKGSEGLDMKCIREVHVLDPWYHMNRTHQIIGRAVRNCSHSKLPVEHRNVTVFLHATTMPNSQRETVDLRVYRIALQKQRLINHVEDIMKKCSIENAVETDAKHSKILLKLMQVSSQGHRAYHSVELPTQVRSKNTGHQASKLASDDVLRHIESSLYDIFADSPMTVREVSDVTGLNDELVAYALESLQKKNSLRRIGNRYLLMDNVNDPSSVAVGSASVSMISHEADVAAVIDANEASVAFRDIIEEPYQNMRRALRNAFPKISDNFNMYILDCCTDALPSSLGLFQILYHVLNSKNGKLEGLVLQSFKNAGIFFEVNRIKFIYDVFTDKYHTYDSLTSSFKESTLMYVDEVKKHKDKYEQESIALSSSIRDRGGVYGVMMKTLRQGFHFKMFTEKHTKYPLICRSTPTISVNVIKNIITALKEQKTFFDFNGIKKRLLCDVAELILRKHDRVIRPVHSMLSINPT